MGVFDVVGQVKEISDLVQKLNNVELYEKILALREQILMLTEDNLSLREQLREVAAQQAIDAELVREVNAYWRIVPGGDKKGPYCLACWDADKLLINMVHGYDPYGEPLVRCMRCAKGFK